MNTVNYDESEYDDHDDMHHMYIHVYTVPWKAEREVRQAPLRVPELDVDETRKFRFYLDT